jgi:streptomycin 6-kinase
MRRIPERLTATCDRTEESRAWLERLPRAIGELEDRWSLALGMPYDGAEVSCAWVAPAVRADGLRAVLKLGMPQMESAHELHGLRFWDGDPTVRVLEADPDLNGMLLEYCDPGIALRTLPESEQDVIIAGLARRLWRRPPAPNAFRPLAMMIAYWSDETMAAAPRWRDAGLVQEGLRLMEELARPGADDVVLATDLHAGNVLSAEREQWLVIDPKPFIGDRAYDATQHLFNCTQRMRTAPKQTIGRFASLLDVDEERVRMWMFARLAAEPRDIWEEDASALARALA